MKFPNDDFDLEVEYKLFSKEENVRVLYRIELPRDERDDYIYKLQIEFDAGFFACIKYGRYKSSVSSLYGIDWFQKEDYVFTTYEEAKEKLLDLFPIERKELTQFVQESEFHKLILHEDYNGPVNVGVTKYKENYAISCWIDDPNLVKEDIKIVKYKDRLFRVILENKTLNIKTQIK